MKRASEVTRALPGAIDVFLMVVESGSDIQTALQSYLDVGPDGPLKDEIFQTLREIHVGVSRAEAFNRLSQRVGAPALYGVTRTILQSMALGSSMGPMLRAQAADLRAESAAEAERQAALAPLKMMAPLFGFIFPAILLVLFGPLSLLMRDGGW
jgi:tight adherence protein C